MNLCFRGRLLALIAFLLLYTALPGVAQEKEWTWKDPDGRTRTRAELDAILRKHKLWVESKGQSGSRADLSGAILTGANLRGADLGDVDLSLADLLRAAEEDWILSGVILGGANLRKADLIDANLSSARLSRADLRDADLERVNLRGANLREADLRNADLRDADLRGAKLFGANLHDAYLFDANLSGANLLGANLRGAFYEPKENPAPELIAYAKNLDWVRYAQSPKPLNDLRRSLKEAGFQAAERQVTAALRRRGATPLETVFFDWTCEFGANAVRPLWIVLLVWLICTPIYWLFLHRGKRSGLYLLASGKEVNTGNERLRVRRLRYRPPRRCRGYRYIFRVAAREWHALSTALLFSLMSAFNIGFREVNFGRWIRMLQPREFDIKARGMARVVSGIQSLLSVGLVTLSLLSYFARPFEV